MKKQKSDGEAPPVGREADGQEEDMDLLARGKTAGLLRRLLRDASENRMRRFALAFFFMAVMAVSTAGLAWIMRYAINAIFLNRDLTAMWVVAGVVLALSVIKGAADYAQIVIMERISNNLVSSFKSRMFAKLVQLDTTYFVRNHSSRIITRVNNNARAASDLVVLLVTSIGRDAFTLIGLVAVMVYQDPMLSIAALAVGPVILLGVVTIVRRVRQLAGAEMKGNADVVAATQETFQGFRTVKAFGLESVMQGRFDGAVRSVEKRRNAIVHYRALVSPLTETLGGVLIASILVYAGWQTIQYGKTPGEFVSFLTAFLLAYEPAKRLASIQVPLQKNLVASSKLYNLLDRPLAQRPGARKSSLDTVAGHLVVNDVGFAYHEADRRRKQVLTHVSIEAHPGEVVAIVGPSGSGKSTLFSLLQGFHDPETGSITIDGVDIGEIDLPELRHHISVVSQDVTLFSGTVADNIRMGRLDATDAEIRQAAEAAVAADFIAQLPHGFDTEISEQGVTFSGGQRQRLAIARAYLRNAPILLLDEATSALDSQTEEMVRRALASLMRGQTVVVIAHRLSTIRRADRIYLLVDGRIVDSGTHGELEARSEEYRKLFGTELLVGDDAA